MAKKISKSNLIRDENGKWLDTSVFRKEALKFMEYGYYTEAPIGTPDWLEYWTEQLRRCKEGYEVDGHKITGHYYGYLNFGQILKTSISEDDENSVAKKEISFPDFWDGDYDYFWALEIARNGLYSKESQVPTTEKEKKKFFELNKKLKLLEENSEEYKKIKKERDSISLAILDRLKLYCKPHLDYLTGGNHFVIAKSRRKGFSYKSGFIVANTYNTLRNSLSTIGSFDKKFNDQTMDKTLFYLNFFNEYTGFSKNRLVDKRDYVKAGYIESINGINVEKGFKSVIDASRTFKDNPDAMRGLDMYLCILEEAGAFDNLLLALSAIKPALTAGSKITGQIVLGGTSGDLGKGTAGYMEVFYNTITYGFMPFENTWDENGADTYCGYFFPVHLNMEGFYDEQGNSDLQGAKDWENRRRKKILESSSSSSVLYQHMQEYPLCPADAFSMTTYSIFPVEELRNRLNKVISQNLHIKKGIPVTLSYDNKDFTKVIAKPDLSGKLEPIWSWKPKNQDLGGSVVIYEFPSPKAPKNFYKIGYDPYRQSEGTSMASIIVFKGHLRGEKTKYKVVAEYYGRPQNADMVNEIALKLALLYNTQIMVENEVTHPITYFERKRALHLLSVQPDNVISNAVKSSKVNRKYGCHMNDKIKEDCEKYTNNWLIDGYSDDYGNTLSTIEEIDSLGLLEELLGYSRKVNCDRVSALFMCMIQLQEQEIQKDLQHQIDRIQEVANYLNKINGKI